jgi:hypothetical protein
VAGFSVHANVAVPVRDRKRLERLCRYVARPPVATERLSLLPDGRVLYAFKNRWKDGSTQARTGTTPRRETATGTEKATSETRTTT